jgi:clostripain
MKIRQVASLIIALILASTTLSCGGGGGGTGGGSVSGRQWTYMVYMGADNNLSNAGIGDINEMEKVGSNENIAVVVQAEFSSQYSQGAPTDTRRIYVQNDNDANSVNLAGTSLGNVNMGDPATLTAFINWAKTTYPAQHYALIVWDHGGGWKAKQLSSPLRGAVQDTTSGSFMSLPNLAKAVSDSGLHFDLINFDACLMAMYEVAYEFKGLTDYMVFSEESEPGDGDPYDTILGALVANPTMNSRTLASTIVDKWHDFYVSDTRESTTKSAVDMAQIDALDAKVVALAKALAANQAGTSTAVLHAQTNTQKYAYEANHDLFHFCQDLNATLSAGAAKTACTDIISLQGTVVISNTTTGTATANSHGLAIYIPQASQTNSTDLADYEKLKCNLTARASASGTWGSYVAALTSGGSLNTTGTGDFAIGIVWTKPDGSACNADLDLIIGEPDGSWYAPFAGQTTPNGNFSQDSAVSGNSSEYYVANTHILPGNYNILVNYYANGSSCAQARVHLMLMEQAYYGDLNWHEENVKNLDLSSPLPSPDPCSSSPLSCYNSYSDMWYPGSMLNRSVSSSITFDFNNDIQTSSKLGGLALKKRKGILLNGLDK